MRVRVLTDNGQNNELLELLKQRLGDTYLIQRELGRGGMSRVFLAEERRLGRKVALKVLPPHLAIGLNVTRFEREISLVAQLHHPNIVPVLQVGDASGLPYFTMPFVAGESLRHRMTTTKVLPIADTVRVLREVALALAHAHSQGIVHRDIKPENVLLSGGVAVVTDFGVAKALSKSVNSQPVNEISLGGLTALGIALGTPAYMSPEQVAADPSIDHRADIYSLGVLGYEMLTGRPPFNGGVAASVMAAQVTTPPAPVNAERQMPKELAALIMRCLAKAPAERPQSAVEVVQEIERVISRLGRTPSREFPVLRVDKGPSARDAGSVAAPRAEATRPRRPHARLVAGLTGAGVLATLLALVVTQDRANGALADTERTVDSTRVSVSALVNASADESLAPAGRVIADYLEQGLSQVERVQVASPSPETTQVLRGATSDARAIANARAVGAGLAILGSYSRAGDSLHVQVKLVDTRTGELVRALAPARTLVSDPTAGLGDTRDRLMGAMALLADSTMGGRKGLPAIDPPRFDAFREMKAGWELTATTDSAKMMDGLARLHRAVALDSTYFIARVVRGIGHINVLRFAAADSIFRTLEDWPHQRTDFERARLEYYIAWLRGDNFGQVRAQRVIAKNVRNGEVGLAVALLADNRPREALAVLGAGPESVRKARPEELRTQSFFWRTQTRAYHALGDHERELAAAIELVRLESGSGSLGSSEALRGAERDRLRALAALGRVDSVEVGIERILVWPPDLGMQPGEVMWRSARELLAHGHREAGRKMLARSVSWFRAHSDLVASSILLQRRFAWALLDAGENAEAEQVARRLERVVRQSDDRLEIETLAGILAARRGDRALVRRIDAKLANSEVVVGRNRAAPFYYRALLAAQMNDRDQAVALLREAIAYGLSPNAYPRLEDIHADPSLQPLRGYAQFERLGVPRG